MGWDPKPRGSKEVRKSYDLPIGGGSHHACHESGAVSHTIAGWSIRPFIPLFPALCVPALLPSPPHITFTEAENYKIQNTKTQNRS